MIFAGVYRPVDQAIISKKSYLTLNVCVNIISIQEKQCGAKNSSLWHTKLRVVSDEQCSSTMTICVLFWRKHYCPWCRNNLIWWPIFCVVLCQKPWKNRVYLYQLARCYLGVKSRESQSTESNIAKLYHKWGKICWAKLPWFLQFTREVFPSIQVPLLSNKHFWLRKCESISAETSVGLKLWMFSPANFSTSMVCSYIIKIPA